MTSPSGRRKATRSGFWLGTGRRRTVAILFALALVALIVLALGGSDVALGSLAFLGGALLGGALAYLISYPLLRMTSTFSRLGQTVASRILGLSLAVGLVLMSMHFTGASPSLDESGNTGGLILGLAVGSVMGIVRRLSPPPIETPEENRC